MLQYKVRLSALCALERSVDGYSTRPIPGDFSTVGYLSVVPHS
jgi:hypothetical protein